MSTNAEAMHVEAQGDLEQRFQALVQSPLRSSLLRHLSCHPEQAFHVESLMQSFGRMRLDIDNCLQELVNFGVARPEDVAGELRYSFQEPSSPAARELVERFRERRVPVSPEDRQRCSGSAR